MLFFRFSRFLSFFIIYDLMLRQEVGPKSNKSATLANKLKTTVRLVVFGERGGVHGRRKKTG